MRSEHKLQQRKRSSVQNDTVSVTGIGEHHSTVYVTATKCVIVQQIMQQASRRLQRRCGNTK